MDMVQGEKLMRSILGFSILRSSILRSSTVAVMFVIGLGISSNAQGIPQGSYQQTCNNVAVNGNVLTANCQDSRGNWINAQLPDVQRCGSDITNDNGVLRCASSGYGPGGYQAGNGPGGSYTQSCRDIHVGGDDLHARCQRRDGSWHDAKLDDYNKCRGDILNDDGNLKCVAGSSYSNPGGYPGG